MPTGISSSTEKRVVLDAGALYRNWTDGVGGGSEELIGATRAGATFEIIREDRDIEVDGAKGPIKGLKRTITHTARLTATLVEVSRQTLLDLTRGGEVSDGTHMTFTPSNDIDAADFYTNIALSADMLGTSDPIVVKLLNALSAQGITVSVDDKDEGEWEVTFEAHYTTADLDTPPYQILLPVNAS